MNHSMTGSPICHSLGLTSPHAMGAKCLLVKKSTFFCILFLNKINHSLTDVGRIVLIFLKGFQLLLLLSILVVLVGGKKIFFYAWVSSEKMSEPSSTPLKLRILWERLCLPSYLPPRHWVISFGPFNDIFSEFEFFIFGQSSLATVLVSILYIPYNLQLFRIKITFFILITDCQAQRITFWVVGLFVLIFPDLRGKRLSQIILLHLHGDEGNGGHDVEH